MKGRERKRESFIGSVMHENRTIVSAIKISETIYILKTTQLLNSLSINSVGNVIEIIPR